MGKKFYRKNYVYPLTFDKVQLEITMAWAHGHFQQKQRATSIFTFTLHESEEYNVVITGAHWNVDGHRIVLKEWNPTIDPRTMDFNFQRYWIDIKKLPPKFLNAELGNQIASILGNVLISIQKMATLRILTI